MVHDIIKKLTDGMDMSERESEYVFRQALSGNISDVCLAAILTALKIKGESSTEIYAGVKVLREKAVHPDVDGREFLDTCGTGGDYSGTFNVSTATAFICAAAGVKVAKHGNRSVSSKCGSFDVLEALGCNINLDEKQVKECMEKTNIGFMYAPLYHKAMKNVSSVRKQIGIRTIFNILGPLVNPVRAGMQLLGVFDEKLMPVVAEVLKKLELKRALVVHGCDGVDEISITGDTQIIELDGGELKEYCINPLMFGIACACAEEVRGGDSKCNASIIMDIFTGKDKGAKRNMLVLNAGAALYTAGKTSDISKGIDMANIVLDSGKSMDKLLEYIQCSKAVRGAV